MKKQFYFLLDSLTQEVDEISEMINISEDESLEIMETLKEKLMVDTQEGWVKIEDNTEKFGLKEIRIYSKVLNELGEDWNDDSYLYSFIHIQNGVVVEDIEISEGDFDTHTS